MTIKELRAILFAQEEQDKKLADTERFGEQEITFENYNKADRCL